MNTGTVRFLKGQGGLPMIRIETLRSTAEIYLHGAHVTHFQKNDEPAILWMSHASKFEDSSPIRGGIPLIFPWFGGRTGAAAHGFARVRAWEVQEVISLDNGAVSVRLRLPDSAQTAEFSGFSVDYIVTVGEVLGLELSVTNTSKDRTFTFEECLHTYFSVGEIDDVSVTGLKGTKYLDKVAGPGEHTEVNEAIKVASEVDRVFLDTQATVEIHDAKLRRKIRVEKEGSESTVVWNPWIAKSKAMPDFGDEEYHGMICVESGNVGKNQMTLGPGKAKSLKVRLSSQPQ